MPASPGSNDSLDARRASVSDQQAQIPPQKIQEQFSDASIILRRALSSWQTMTAVSPLRVSGACNQLDTLQDLSVAFSVIARMCEFSRRLQSDGSDSEDKAAADYRESLAQFRLQLPRIQGWLIVERARLARRSSHSAAVVSWAETNRQTREPNRPGHAKR